jgi:hypothetical protein
MRTRSGRPALYTGKRGGQLLADFSLLDLLVVVVSPLGAPLFEVVVEDSEDFSDADGAAGAAAGP